MEVNNTNGATTPSVEEQRLMEASKWINGFIIILGLVTNSLIIVVLSRSRLGSVTTKIILLFLAVTDILVMLTELLLHYIPMYMRIFPVFYEHTCGLAMVMQALIITSSSWYITLMTIERFIVVWFPMKARSLCTKKTVITACCCVPIICLLIYSYLFPNMESTVQDGYTLCQPKQTQGTQLFKAIMQVWITAYFFVPAAVIVSLNGAIVYKLKAAGQKQSQLTQSSKYRLCNISACLGRDKNENRENRSMQGVRKATVLVIVASVTFVLLMIPRGISTTIVMDVEWKYDSHSEKLFDSITYLLQYLNHATNFFIYILANAAFRRELVKVLCCKKRKRRGLGAQSTMISTVPEYESETNFHSDTVVGEESLALPVQR